MAQRLLKKTLARVHRFVLALGCRIAHFCTTGFNVFRKSQNVSENQQRQRFKRGFYLGKFYISVNFAKFLECIDCMYLVRVEACEEMIVESSELSPSNLSVLFLLLDNESEPAAPCAECCCCLLAVDVAVVPVPVVFICLGLLPAEFIEVNY